MARLAGLCAEVVWLKLLVAIQLRQAELAFFVVHARVVPDTWRLCLAD